MQQRYYDPVAGRFLSVDPIVTDANTGKQFGRYAYVDNNPFRYVDPDGLDKRDEQIAEQQKKERDRFCGVTGCEGESRVSASSNADGGRGASDGASANSQSERTWGSYLPGTEAGENSAQYWADMQVQTGNPLYAVPGVFASLWTPNTAADTLFTLVPAGAAGALGRAAGPLKQWIRIGPSFSKAAGAPVSMSIRWGASPIGGGKYLRMIPSQTLRDLNQWLRAQNIPGFGWRSADPGHFHLW